MFIQKFWVCEPNPLSQVIENKVGDEMVTLTVAPLEITPTLLSMVQVAAGTGTFQ